MYTKVGTLVEKCAYWSTRQYFGLRVTKLMVVVLEEFYWLQFLSGHNVVFSVL